MDNHGQCQFCQYGPVGNGIDSLISILGQNVKKLSIETVLFVFIICGAEGETRTPTRKPGLDPEPSASTSSATSALSSKIDYSDGFQGLL